MLLHLSVLTLSVVDLPGSHCWGRENVLGVGGWSWKVPRSPVEVWEVVWAPARGKACHVLLMQLLERQSALPRVALPQHKLLVLLFLSAGSRGWVICLILPCWVVVTCGQLDCDGTVTVMGLPGNNVIWNFFLFIYEPAVWHHPWQDQPFQTFLQWFLHYSMHLISFKKLEGGHN